MPPRRRPQRPPIPPVPAPPVPPAPPAPPVPPRRRRPARRFSATLFWVVVSVLAALFAANLAGYGPALVSHESVRVILPPQRPAQPAKQLARRHSAPKPPATVSTPIPPEVTKELAKDLQELQNELTKVRPPVLVPAHQSVDVNININVRGLPDRSVQAATCPKVGHYVLSHEPTTDSRQYDDRGNWNPGHMELVRECRNGALVEFPRWIGHHLPSAPAPYYLTPQAP